MTKRNGYISASDFISAITVQAVDFEVAGVGKFKVRGLTVAELERLRPLIAEDERKFAIEAIGIGLVSPELSRELIEQLDQYKAGAQGVINELSTRIIELSGMGEADELQKKVGSSS